MMGAARPFRKAHGKAAEGGALVVTESKPWDEQRRLSGEAAPPIARKRNGQPASSADASRMAKLPRRRALVPKEARPYRRLRGLEFERMHGALSTGVAAYLDAEACAWLAGKKAAAKAAESGDREDIAAMTKAFDCARQLAKDSWQVASLEKGEHAKGKPPIDPLAEDT